MVQLHHAGVIPRLPPSLTTIHPPGKPWCNSTPMDTKAKDETADLETGNRMSRNEGDEANGEISATQ